VLIVDDSLVARTVLTRLIEPRTELECSGAVATVDQALQFLGGRHVDIIVLDVEMPGKDGLTALPEILAASHGARVLIVSSTAEAGASATVRALTLGAADTLFKPSAGNFAGEFAGKFVESLLRIGHAGVDIDQAVQAWTASPRSSAQGAVALRPAVGGAIECLAIGASTGGLHALAAFLCGLKPEFTAPILITQHLPATFMRYFASQLQDLTGRPAAVAENGDALAAGRMLIAPGTAHISLERDASVVRIRLDSTPAISRCLPSVDPMFEAVARIYGPAGVGVVLTGMGRDGTLGAEALAAAGGEILAQDAITSVVWGMPGSVARAGLASAVLPPEKLAAGICARVGLC
jgi:two-component system chemotaxis response regulator CheB